MRKWIDLLRESLKEVEMSGEQEVALDEFGQHFEHSEIVWLDPNNHDTNIKYVDGINQEMLGLFRGEQLIALLVTEPFYRDPEVRQIKLTAVAPEERGKGFMRLLITFYRKDFGSICSDGINSPDAREMWKALIARPGGLKIVVWDTETDEKRPAKGLPDAAIWDNEEATVLLVEDLDALQYGFGEKLFEERLRYPHHRRWGVADDLNP
jgi:PAS domain-containing protein